jgi:hypothetical protein
MGFTPSGTIWLTTKAGDLFYTDSLDTVENFSQVNVALGCSEGII